MYMDVIKQDENDCVVWIYYFQGFFLITNMTQSYNFGSLGIQYVFNIQTFKFYNSAFKNKYYI